MRYETKKGLFKSKPLPISAVYKNKLDNDRNFTTIIINFSKNSVIRDLLFNFVNSLTYSMSIKTFKKQLNLLEPLTLDEQIRIINKTLDNGWNSLVYEYDKIIKGKLKQ